jgi:O-methyltransferase
MSITKTSVFRSVIHKSFRTFGLDVVRFPAQVQEFPPDFRSDESAIVREVQPWTMTSAERIYALIQAVRYVTTNGIAGAIVECGVWKGGSMAAVAKALLQLQDVTRDLYLFDTFQGMSEPTAQDLDYSGKQAADLLATNPAFSCGDAPLEAVKKVLHQTGYPPERIHFVVGKVEDTIPKYAPESISLLRLDTDWYESTKHELVHLFPRVAARGPIIIDDYGHWKGARQACDEYFTQNRIPILLNRIDYTGRIAVKL